MDWPYGHFRTYDFCTYDSTYDFCTYDSRVSISKKLLRHLEAVCKTSRDHLLIQDLSRLSIEVSVS